MEHSVSALPAPVKSFHHLKKIVAFRLLSFSTREAKPFRAVRATTA